MPRIENVGENVRTWHTSPESGGNGSSTWDVCSKCYQELQGDPHAFDQQLVPYNGDPPGEDGRMGDEPHPPYSDDDYTCAVCGATLTDDDRY